MGSSCRKGLDDGNRRTLGFNLGDGHALVLGLSLDRVLEEDEDEDDGDQHRGHQKEEARGEGGRQQAVSGARRSRHDSRRLVALPGGQRRPFSGRVRDLDGCSARAMCQRARPEVQRDHALKAGSPVETLRPMTTPSWSELLKMPPATPANSLGIDIIRAMFPLQEACEICQPKEWQHWQS